MCHIVQKGIKSELKIDWFHLVVESKQKNRQGIIQVSLLYVLKIGNEQCLSEEKIGSKQSQSLYSFKRDSY